MRVLRRLFVAGALVCFPAAALGPGCAKPLENLTGLPNEVSAKPSGAISQMGGSSANGGSGGGGGSGGSGTGGAAAMTIALCECAARVTVGCTTCFNAATAPGGTCVSMNDACGPNTACNVTASCVTGCVGNPTCIMSCITVPSLSPAYVALLDCLCTQCDNSCPATQTCTTSAPADAGSD